MVRYEPDVCSDGHGVEVYAILGIIITNEIRRRDAEGCRLTQLLSDPLVRWRPGDADMNDAPRAELGDEEREERPKEHVGDLKEIAGPDVSGVVVEKGCPGLMMRAWPCLAHIPLNGS